MTTEPLYKPANSHGSVGWKSTDLTRSLRLKNCRCRGIRVSIKASTQRDLLTFTSNCIFKVVYVMVMVVTEIDRARWTVEM